MASTGTQRTRGSRTALVALSAAVFVAVGLPAARADDPDNCLFCHQYRGLSCYDADTGRLHIFYVQPEYTRARLGPHARVACTDCHARDEVAVVPHDAVSRVDCTRTCHLRSASGESRRFTHLPIAMALQESVHAPQTLEKLTFQGGPLLAADQSQCLYCHDEPLFRDPRGLLPQMAPPEAAAGGLLDRCDACHAQQVPVDTSYAARHVIARMQPARPTLEQVQVCAVCHADPDVLAAHELDNAIASYLRSFHGKAALLGDQSTADCVACHVGHRDNVHRMLAVTDPASSVHEDNVANTCRSIRCHPGADPAIASASVHLNLSVGRGTIEFLLAAFFIVLTLLTYGPSMAIVVLEQLNIFVGRHHPAAHRVQALTRRLEAHPKGRILLQRFTVSQRVQHWVLALLFILLALTGFPMKFADKAWAAWLVDELGGLGVVRTLHHWAGLALVAGLAMHLIYVLFTLRERMRAAPGQRRPGFFSAVNSLPMWVTPGDGLKMMQLLFYLVGLRKHPPTFGRFTIKEKFEYIGVFWGTVLLGITGVMLWAEQIVSHYLTGRVFNLALIAHTYEAFLAIIHVGILHIINVMLKPNVFPLSPATITGRTPTTEMAEEHSEQVEEAARQLGLATERGAQHG